MTPQCQERLSADAAVNFHNDLVRVIRETLGLPEKVAVPMADELARGLRARMRGLVIPVREIRAAHETAVLRDFTGNNHREVMRHHNISRSTLYRILRRDRLRVKTSRHETRGTA